MFSSRSSDVSAAKSEPLSDGSVTGSKSDMSAAVSGTYDNHMTTSHFQKPGHIKVNSAPSQVRPKLNTS